MEYTTKNKDLLLRNMSKEERQYLYKKAKFPIKILFFFYIFISFLFSVTHIYLYSISKLSLGLILSDILILFICIKIRTFNINKIIWVQYQIYSILSDDINLPHISETFLTQSLKDKQDKKNFLKQLNQIKQYVEIQKRVSNVIMSIKIKHSKSLSIKTLEKIIKVLENNSSFPLVITETNDKFTLIEIEHITSKNYLHQYLKFILYNQLKNSNVIRFNTHIGFNDIKFYPDFMPSKISISNLRNEFPSNYSLREFKENLNRGILNPVIEEVVSEFPMLKQLKEYKNLNNNEIRWGLIDNKNLDIVFSLVKKKVG